MISPSYVTRRQLRWPGHVAKMSDDRLLRKMLTSWVKEKIPRCAHEFTYGRGDYEALKKVIWVNPYYAFRGR